VAQILPLAIVKHFTCPDEMPIKKTPAGSGGFWFAKRLNASIFEMLLFCQERETEIAVEDGAAWISRTRQLELRKTPRELARRVST
jgi:hypothetical protein